MVRAPPCHGGGCGFEPRRLRTLLSDFFRTHHRLSYAQHLEGRKKTCTGASNSRMAALMVAVLVITHLAACDATAKAPSPDVDAPYFNECKQRPGTAPMHAAPQGMRASLRNLRGARPARPGLHGTPGFRRRSKSRRRATHCGTRSAPAIWRCTATPRRPPRSRATRQPGLRSTPRVSSLGSQRKSGSRSPPTP